jgi:hypothetical protein
MAKKLTIGTMILQEIVPPLKSGPRITIGVFVEDEEFPEYPIQVFEEPVPTRFPKKLVKYLADFMARGFNGAIREWPQISRLNKRAVGRPLNPAVQRIGEEAAKLHSEGLSYGQVARKLCPHRGQQHKCDKKCSDRIRQAAKPFLKARGTTHENL